MVKAKRPYDKKGAKEIWLLNKKNKLEGKKPVKRYKKKTNRKYVYSGRFVGANGGKRRVFKKKEIQRVMKDSISPYIDTQGRSIKKKKNIYQGKYQNWFNKSKEKNNNVPKEKQLTAYI